MAAARPADAAGPPGPRDREVPAGPDRPVRREHAQPSAAPDFQVFAVVVPIAIGIVRYATTRYRIHGDRVELKRGLISTHLTSTPLDRVRTVDLTASPVHRILGVATLRIGTGTASKEGEDGLDLDGLGADRGPRAARPAADLDRRPDGDRGPTARSAARRGRRAAGGAVRAGLAAVRAVHLGRVRARRRRARCRQPGARRARRVRRPRRRPDRRGRRGRRRAGGDPGRCSWRSACWPRSSRCSATSSPTATSRSATPRPTAPGTYAAGCSPPARPASTTTGCAASRSASRGGCGWSAAAGSTRS